MASNTAMLMLSQRVIATIFSSRATRAERGRWLPTLTRSASRYAKRVVADTPAPNLAYSLEHPTRLDSEYYHQACKEDP